MKRIGISGFLIVVVTSLASFVCMFLLDKVAEYNTTRIAMQNGYCQVVNREVGGLGNFTYRTKCEKDK